ncbi:Neuropilin-2 [Myotis brandtii]|uniref:Neuropilin-2 n=1 Tax=Myotis brandtii TaxID=109478 RepID=S7PVW8_MYOBR|nr:Neuropilin-2 [Myotis brandtii]
MCLELLQRRQRVDIPEVHGREGYEDEIVDEYEVDWSNASSSTSGSSTPSADKEKSWLYTLDPILITIIAMSSLGVLLGATCAGLLLYCTCSYSGLSSRSCTTLENYNFELYDGLKHKVKMNHQKCCSEA